MFYHKKQKSGFTLIELLVVIAIIGILAAVIAMNLGKAQRRAVDATIKRDFGSLQTQSYIYYQDHDLSYVGFCQGPKGTDIMSKVDELNDSGAVDCQNTDKTWASSAYLKTAGTFCVDSAGSSMVNGAINANGVCEYDASLANVQGGGQGGGGEEGGEGGASNPDAVVKLGGGYGHACAIFTGGIVKCWGSNYYGQLGDGQHGNAYDSDQPVEIDDGDTYVDVSVGSSHACGITSAGAVKCWGRNNYGQLGTTGGGYSDTPILLAGGDQYTHISAGDYHTCGVTSSGVAKCWGNNNKGQLGGGSAGGNAAIPVTVVGGDTYIDISASHSRTCGVTSNHEGKCWGQELYQSFGNGPDHSSNYSTPQLILGGDSWQKIAAHGTVLHACGLTTSGNVKCWGHNSSGCLGTGDTNSSDVPVEIDDNSTYSDVEVLGSTTCGLLASGGVKCWGYNQYGKSAQGVTTGYITSPNDIVGGLNFAEISSWSETVFGRTPAGEIKVWGRNSVGEMNNSSPVDVFSSESGPTT